MTARYVNLHFIYSNCHHHSIILIFNNPASPGKMAVKRRERERERERENFVGEWSRWCVCVLQFIRTNRRPVLTFDDALRDVKQEMGLV